MDSNSLVRMPGISSEIHLQGKVAGYITAGDAVNVNLFSILPQQEGKYLAKCLVFGQELKKDIVPETFFELNGNGHLYFKPNMVERFIEREFQGTLPSVTGSEKSVLGEDVTNFIHYTCLDHLIHGNNGAQCSYNTIDMPKNQKYCPNTNYIKMISQKIASHLYDIISDALISGKYPNGFEEKFTGTFGITPDGIYSTDKDSFHKGVETAVNFGKMTAQLQKKPYTIVLQVQNLTKRNLSRPLEATGKDYVIIPKQETPLILKDTFSWLRWMFNTG